MLLSEYQDNVLNTRDELSNYNKMKNEEQNLDNSQGNGVLPCVSGSFITDVEKLTNDIIKYFPKFFDDFTNFEYGTGVDAGKDFKKIFNKAKKLNKAVSKNVLLF